MLTFWGVSTVSAIESPAAISFASAPSASAA